MTTKSPKKVYADFNNCDGECRVRLITMGSRRDLEHLGPLEEGDMLDLYDTELRVLGKAEFSELEKIWTARFDPEELISIDS
jgi:hypothetical protein